ncbi:MAG: hypothetical protein Q4F06_01550 [Eubacteriales bacterium]|nr:hypothetical protein [Eubacteriales bacterium]
MIMMEINKTFNKRIIILYCSLLILIMFVFYRNNANEYQVITKDNENLTVNNFEIYTICNDGIKYYNNLDVTNVEERLSNTIQMLVNNNDINNPNVKRGIDLFVEKIEYVNEYKNTINKEILYADYYNNNALFVNNDSFFNKNLYNTKGFMKKIADINVIPSNHTAIEKVVKSNYIQYVLIIFLILIVIGFFDERKNGMWEIIHIASNGRTRLLIKRILLLLLASIFICLITYVAVFMMSYRIYGGIDSLPNYIHSESSFSRCSLLVSGYDYIVIFIIIKALYLFVIGLLSFMVLSLFRNNHIGCYVLIAMFLIEYILYNSIPYKSKIVALKYFNIFQLIIPNNYFMEYKNCVLFWGIIDEILFTVYYALMLSIILIIFTIIINNKMHPISEIEHFAKTKALYYKIKGMILIRMPLFFLELWKLLISQKIIIILILGIVIANNNSVQRGVLYDAEMIETRRIYEQIEGSLVEDAKTYMNHYDAETEIINQKSSRGYNDYVVSLRKNASNNVWRNIKYLEDLKEKNNFNGVMMLQYEYEGLLNNTVSKNQGEISFIVVLTMCLSLFSIFSFESKSKMTYLNNASLNRKKLLITKMSVGVFITFLLWGTIYIPNALNILKLYNIQNSNNDIRNLMCFESVSFNCSISTFLLLIVIGRLAVMILLFFVLSIITYNKTYIVALLMSLIIPIMHIPYLLEWKYGSAISPISILSFTEVFNAFGMNMVLCLVYVVLILLIIVRWNVKLR